MRLSQPIEMSMEIQSSSEPLGLSKNEEYALKVSGCTLIAKPMAGRKLTRKIFKLVKLAMKKKENCSNGIKDVQTNIRRDVRGLVFIAGDITPIDVLCHIPILCEEKDMPYCFVPRKKELGLAMGIKRGTVMAMVKFSKEYGDLYKECKNAIHELPYPFE